MLLFHAGVRHAGPNARKRYRCKRVDALFPWNMTSVRARLDQRDSAFETLPNASTRLMLGGLTGRLRTIEGMPIRNLSPQTQRASGRSRPSPGCGEKPETTPPGDANEPDRSRARAEVRARAQLHHEGGLASHSGRRAAGRHTHAALM
jgi:hypothetical protein